MGTDNRVSFEKARATDSGLWHTRRLTLPLFGESHNRGNYAASPCWAANQFFSNVMGLT
jgi:hypothetical protein